MRRVHVLSLALALAAGPASYAQETVPYAIAGRPAAYHVAADSAAALIERLMQAAGAPGASVTVMRDGQTLWSRGFGRADIEQQVPATSLTRFRIGSVSKSLTAAALGLLVEEGKLDLDSPVQRYVPSFPVKRWPITVRQVAGHLAGIRHYRGGEFASQRHFDSVTEALAVFKDDSLLFEPGTRYSYSSYGWNLLSAVVEGASGEPFLRFMQRRVFVPAGMLHTVADYPDSIIPFRSRFYTRADSAGGVLNAAFVDNSVKWAGGGFLSTTEDLARFGQALLTGSLLKPETIQLLWRSQRTKEGKETEYGIGWGVRSDSTGRTMVSHTGGAMGGTAFLLIYPKEKLVVATLLNSDRSIIDARKVGELFFRYGK
jgi:CubicO group peptidase (beta-lactamase class C family)